MNKLTTALESMSVLNAWAKNQIQCGPRKAIYWLKSHYAIRDALLACLVRRFRVLLVRTRCNRCRDGTYYDWDGFAHGDCRHCEGSGKVELRFIETTIEISGKPAVWHTPIRYDAWDGWKMDDIVPVEAEDWTVGAPGIELDAEMAATHLNVVEEYWPQWRKQSPYELSREEWDTHRYYLFNYSLDLPRIPERCVLCKGEHSVFANLTIAPGLHLSRSICSACEKNKELWTRLKALPMPPLSEAIQRWRKRHSLDFEAAWKRDWHDTWADLHLEPRPEPPSVFRIVTA